jgi:hypothetical protein
MGQLSVLDSRGAAVFSYTLDLSLPAQQVDLRALPAGLYLLQIIQNGRSVFTERIVLNN